MRRLRFEHIALHVVNIERSNHFYGKLLGLKQLERPNFPFNGSWFELDEGLQLHLIEGMNYQPHSGNRGNHFAFIVKDAVELEKELAAQGVEIVVNKLRVDGIRQLFVKDPDGYFVEFNEG